jgi:hypothetical protein
MLKDAGAAQLLADLACEVLFRYPGPMPRDELWQNVSAQLPVTAGVLTDVLAADERFEDLGARWELRPRQRPPGGPWSAPCRPCWSASGSRWPCLFWSPSSVSAAPLTPLRLKNSYAAS